jgi:hypothetical protein
MRKSAMSSAPETLTLSRHRDREGWVGPWPSRIGIALLGAIVIAALLDVFGQRPQTSTATSGAAQLQISAPTHLRSGLIYTARFRIDALREIKRAVLVLAPGWAEGYTFNGAAPQPASESSADGKLSLTLGRIPRGQRYTLFVSLQVNPTTVGHPGQTVWLYDGSKPLLTIHRKILIWP